MQTDEIIGKPERGIAGGLGLIVIILCFLAIRLPVVIHSPASQDEEWYGVPGLTIATEGLPRVPYCRARDKGSVFIGAERLLFAQPPLSFYSQAPFFALLPAGYATARLASLTAACLSIVLVYSIGSTLLKDRRIALTAAALYSFSRLLFFPAMSARPDMLCGAIGLVAVWSMLRWKDRPYRAAVISGIALGLAALTHPFALVFAIQLTVWTLASRNPWPVRLKSTAVLVVATAATFSLWLPLILMDSDLFWSQFADNILRPAGPGLLSRFVMPQAAIANQIPQLFVRSTPIQFTILAIGILAALVIAVKKRDASAGLCLVLAISGIYLLIVCVGIHPIQGFWCYPAALSWICVSHAFFSLVDKFSETKWAPTGLASLAIAVLFVAMLPGGGVRATWTYLKHHGDPNFSSRPFVKQILSDIPDQATLTVGREFALDAYGTGRDLILACRHPMYFDSAKWPTDYFILGRRDFEAEIVEGYESMGHDLHRIKTYGDRKDPLANYAELWVRTE